MAWTTPRTWVAGETVTASIMNLHVRDNLTALNGYVRKTADESVTSSAVLQNDDHLAVAIPAAGTYEITLNLLVLGNTAGDMRLGATFPAGTMTMSVDALDTAATAVSGTVSRQSATLTSGVDPGVGIGVLASVVLARVTFFFIATASGTFQFQWAQSVSNVTATTVKTNSYLKMQQIV